MKIELEGDELFAITELVNHRCARIAFPGKSRFYWSNNDKTLVLELPDEINKNEEGS
jgi:hypothetical protein